MTEEEQYEYNKIVTEMNTINREYNNLLQKCLEKDKELSNLNKKIRRYEKMINSMIAAGQMITQHKEQRCRMIIDDFIVELNDYENQKEQPHKFHHEIKHIYRPVCPCYAEGYGEDTECNAPCICKKTDKFGLPVEWTPQVDMECGECLRQASDDYERNKFDHTIKRCIKDYPQGYVDPRNGKRYSTKEAFRLVRKFNKRIK